MKDVRNIPDRFKYPLPREHSNRQRPPQQNANIRNQGFDRRKLDHDRKYKDFDDRRNYDLHRRKQDFNQRNHDLNNKMQPDKERRKFSLSRVAVLG